MISASMRRRARIPRRVSSVRRRMSGWLRSWGSSWLSYRSVVLGRDGSLRSRCANRQARRRRSTCRRAVDREGRVLQVAFVVERDPPRHAGPVDRTHRRNQFRRLRRTGLLRGRDQRGGRVVRERRMQLDRRAEARLVCVSNALPPGIRSSGRPGSSASRRRRPCRPATGRSGSRSRPRRAAARSRRAGASGARSARPAHRAAEEHEIRALALDRGQHAR